MTRTKLSGRNQTGLTLEKTNREKVATSTIRSFVPSALSSSRTSHPRGLMASVATHVVIARHNTYRDRYFCGASRPRNRSLRPDGGSSCARRTLVFTKSYGRIPSTKIRRMPRSTILTMVPYVPFTTGPATQQSEPTAK